MATQTKTVIDEQTGRKAFRFTLKWTIDNFASYRNDCFTLFDSGITMAELGFRESMPGRWCIGMVPCHKIVETSGQKRFVGIALGFFDVTSYSVYSGPYKLHADFHLRLTTGKSMTLVKEHQTTAVFSKRKNVCHNKGFLRQDRLLGNGQRPGLIRDNLITILMDIKIHDQAYVDCTPELTVTTHYQRRQRYWQAENYRNSADVVLRANDGNVFPAHRFLLAADSPVFADMFKCDSQGTQSGGPVLVDMDGECVEVLLAFVYSGDLTAVTVDNAEKMLIMADTYQIMDLRGVCETILANNVQERNAEHDLELARQRQLPILQDAARNVTCHAPSVQRTTKQPRCPRSGRFLSLRSHS
ncbi:speckle-type POZ protein B-like [Paramacrobiotus metropolitanus]|uniref:speckle-type POZ protein B-like n=1 Tax=Paramacrobiotus metropolitanus TaxID=2943436 RepID=UPI0024456B30|nr:speckle-type POZ protein B-like [Paramacrobiotus metropolitanus]